MMEIGIISLQREKVWDFFLEGQKVDATKMLNKKTL